MSHRVSMSTATFRLLIMPILMSAKTFFQAENFKLDLVNSLFPVVRLAILVLQFARAKTPSHERSIET